MPAEIRFLLNGVHAQSGDLAALAHDYGHYTSFIAHGCALRGWSLHLQRLQDDAAAMGLDLDLARLSAQLRQALSLASPDTPQSVRISVHPTTLDLRRLAAGMPATVLIQCRDWLADNPGPLRLCSHAGLREAPRHKHLGLSGPLLARRQAQLTGADDALLLGGDACIAEGPTWNLALYDGAVVHWPNAPALHGSTQRLLAAALVSQGVRCTSSALRVADLREARAVIACNARHACMPITAIDGHVLHRDLAFEALLVDTWKHIPLEQI